MPRPLDPARRSILLAAALPAVLVLTAPVGGQESSGSLMSRTMAAPPPPAQGGPPHALRDRSLFAIAPPETRVYGKHDLVQIIVRESSRAKSSQELDTEKDYDLDGRVSAWPHLTLSDLLKLQLEAGNSTDLPAVRLGLSKDFQGEGDYEREDDLTARLTAEVIEVLPNGNLVLEARTRIRTDEEESDIRVTGVCQPADVTAANTILSNQIHDLRIDKVHEGELKKTNEKGIIAKFFDTLFAF